MEDLDVYLGAFTRATHGANPYLATFSGDAFLYPMPALLILAPLAWIQFDLFRAAVYQIVPPESPCLQAWG